jgi:hypothetical protein
VNCGPNTIILIHGLWMPQRSDKTDYKEFPNRSHLIIARNRLSLSGVWQAAPMI